MHLDTYLYIPEHILACYNNGKFKPIRIKQYQTILILIMNNNRNLKNKKKTIKLQQVNKINN